MTDRYASLKQGLVGCWIPSISGSGLLLPDLSGRGNNGALTNMDASDWVSSQYGRALDFDGVNDYLEYGRCDQLSGLSVLSCSFWCYPKSVNGMYAIIRYNTTTGLGSERRADYFGIEATGGILYPACYFSVAGAVTTFQSFTSTSLPIAQNTWSHVAFNVNLAGNTATIAVNGVSVAGTRSSGGTPPTATAAQGTVTWRSQTYIGSGGTQFYFDGQLDDVRIYNRALTESEIRLLASEPGIGFKPAKKLSRFSQRYTYKPPKARNYGVTRVKETDYATLRQGLVGAWCPSLPNGGSGNTLPDVSGYGNHGSLVNMGPEDWVSASYGRALDFDGSNDFIEFSSSALLGGSGSMTLLAHVRAASLSLPANVIISKMQIANDQPAYLFGFLSNGKFYFATTTGSTAGVQEYQSSSATLPTTVWSHVAVSYTWGSGASLQLYLNGSQVAGSWTTGNGDVTFTGTATLTQKIGRLQHTGVNTFFSWNGNIDDARIYNRILTESEIKLLASRPGIGLRQESHRNTFYQFPSGARRRKILTGMP